MCVDIRSLKNPKIILMAMSNVFYTLMERLQLSLRIMILRKISKVYTDN